MKLGEAMYKAQQGGDGAAQPEGAQAQPEDDVVDAEFEEVDGDEKSA
jgi:molecular chaperone DnaK